MEKLTLCASLQEVQCDLAARIKIKIKCLLFFRQASATADNLRVGVDSVLPQYKVSQSHQTYIVRHIARFFDSLGA